MHSVHLADTHVYMTGLQPGHRPTTQYVANGQKVCARQVVLAGLRLAQILKKLTPESPGAVGAEDADTRGGMESIGGLFQSSVLLVCATAAVVCVVAGLSVVFVRRRILRVVDGGACTPLI